jgi:uncharacterized UPF0160 family protein
VAIFALERRFRRPLVVKYAGWMSNIGVPTNVERQAFDHHGRVTEKKKKKTKNSSQALL